MNVSIKRLVAVAVVVIVAVTGCSVDSEGAEMDAQQIVEIKRALRDKGPVENEVRRLEVLLVEMADAVAALVPRLTWHRAYEESQAGCEAVPGDPTSASKRVLSRVAFDGPIPDTTWPAALAAVRERAARVGATKLVVRVDKPANHDILLIGPDKVEFGFGSLVAALLVAETSCYLTNSDLADPSSAGL